MDFGGKVWVPDNEHGFLLGTIVDIGADAVTVELDGQKGKVSWRDVQLCIQTFNLKYFKNNFLFIYELIYVLNRLFIYFLD